MEKLDRKNILALWLIILFFTIGEIFLQVTPYIHIHHKSDYIPGEYRLSSFRTEYDVRHSKKYSIFTDNSGNTVKVYSSLKDHKGRKVKLYVRNSEDAFREKFELKYINICDIAFILCFIVTSAVTVSWIIKRKAIQK